MERSSRWRIRPLSQQLVSSERRAASKYNSFTRARTTRRNIGNSMQPQPEYGPRLSDEEYETRILSLYRSLPPMPSSDQDREARRQELNLAIDHRLGRDFPEERRSLLWAAQRRIEKKRLRLAMKYLLRRFLARLLARDAQALAGYAAEEYGKVLSAEELRRFLVLEKYDTPALPIDIKHLNE